MNNPKTTTAGYLVLAAAVLVLVAHCLQGNCMGASDVTALMGALAGIGLIAAKDGGH